MTHNDFTIYTAKNGGWKVVTLLDNGTEASYDDLRFTSQATAALYAIKCHEAKPHMNYAVRAA